MLARLALAGVLLVLSSAPGWADRSSTWFALKADATTAASRTAPVGPYFFSIDAHHEGIARLEGDYELTPGKPEGGVLRAGALLYMTRTQKEIYYCSARGVREVEGADILADAAVRSLTFGLFSGTPKAVDRQCFRDSDEDGRFDIVAVGVHDHSFLTFRMFISITGFRKLPSSIGYSRLPAGSEPPLTIGLSASFRGSSKRSLRITACLKSQKGEFTLDEAYCFDRASQTVEVGELPQKLDFLGGEITITEIATGPGGDVIHYTLSRPLAAEAVTVETQLQNRYGGVARNLYMRPVVRP